MLNSNTRNVISLVLYKPRYGVRLRETLICDNPTVIISIIMSIDRNIAVPMINSTIFDTPYDSIIRKALYSVIK